MATTPRRRSASASTDKSETAAAATTAPSSAALAADTPATKTAKAVKPAKKTAAKTPKPTPKPNAKSPKARTAKSGTPVAPVDNAAVSAPAAANPAAEPEVASAATSAQTPATDAATKKTTAKTARTPRAKTAARTAKPTRAKTPGVKPSAKTALRAKAARAPEVPAPVHSPVADDAPDETPVLSEEALASAAETTTQVDMAIAMPAADAALPAQAEPERADSSVDDDADHPAEDEAQPEPFVDTVPAQEESRLEAAWDEGEDAGHDDHDHDRPDDRFDDEAPVAPPRAPARQGPSRITLADQPDGRRQLIWDLGEPCPQTVRQAVARWLDADGALALQEPESVDELLALAMRCGHRIDVGAGVWTHLARRGDLRQRIAHLEACYPQGLAALHVPEPEAAQAMSPLPGLSPRPAQWEAAFFAACAGTCLLADSPELDAPRELALAWQLVQRHFGARRLVVQVSAEHLDARQTEWLARLAAVPGLEAASVSVLSIDAPLPPEGAEVLIIDQRDGWLPAPPALASRDAQASWTWAWVLAHPDTVLADTEAAEGWLAWLDRLGLGVVAQGLAQADRKALTTLLLARDWDEVAEQWPAWNHQVLSAPWTPETVAEHEQASVAVRALLKRWQASGFMSDTDQLALQETLQRDAQAERETALAQIPALLNRAVAEGVRRVVVFTEGVAEPALPGWAQALAGEGRNVQVLPMAYREAEDVVRAFRDGEGLQVLLAPDGVPGIEPRIPCSPHRPWVIHLDLPWEPGAGERRLQRLRLPRGERAVPVWQLLAEAGLSAHRFAQAPVAPAAATAIATGWTSRLRRGEALQSWLTALQACVFGTAPAPEATPVPAWPTDGAVLDAGTPVPSQGDDTPTPMA